MPTCKQSISFFKATVMLRNWNYYKSPGTESKTFHSKLKEWKRHTYILVRHLPVGSLPVRHDLPHHDPIAPDITSRGKLSESYSFWGSPSDWNFASLKLKKDNKFHTLQMYLGILLSYWRDLERDVTFLSGSVYHHAVSFHISVHKHW